MAPSSHPNACRSHFGSPDKLPARWHACCKPNKLTQICKRHEPSYLATVLTPAWIKHRTARASPKPTPSSFMLASLYSKGFFSSWSNFLVSGVWREHGLASKQDCETHNRLWYTSELVKPICVLQETGEEEALWRQVSRDKSDWGVCPLLFIYTLYLPSERLNFILNNKCGCCWHLKISQA